MVCALDSMQPAANAMRLQHKLQIRLHERKTEVTSCAFILMSYVLKLLNMMHYLGLHIRTKLLSSTLQHWATKISTWTADARRGAATLLLDVRRTPLTGQVVEKAILSVYVRPQCGRPSVRCCAVSKAEKGLQALAFRAIHYLP